MDLLKYSTFFPAKTTLSTGPAYRGRAGTDSWAGHARIAGIWSR
jgi:hypothetical protein